MAMGLSMSEDRSTDLDRIALRSRQHEGAPPLNLEGPPVSFFEFLPGKVFYLPVAFYMCYLALKYRGATLPSIANPLFPYGGIIGESKSDIFDLFGGEAKKHLPPHVTLEKSNTPIDAQKTEAIKKTEAAGLALPVVAKPDLGCRGAGVQLIEDWSDLADYIAAFPAGQRFLLQEFVDYEGEAGVFYIREPGQKEGQIFSLTLKYFPFIRGDGKQTIGELIESDPRARVLKHVYFERHKDRLDHVLPAGTAMRLSFAGSHSRGTIFRDGNAYVTKEMTRKFDEIATDVREFYFGRFDVRFKDIESLQRGEDFKIMEVNGGAGEATHIWDNRMSIGEAYRVLFEQFDTLWRIGALNRKRGFKSDKMLPIVRAYYKEFGLHDQYPVAH